MKIKRSLWKIFLGWICIGWGIISLVAIKTETMIRTTEEILTIPFHIVIAPFAALIAASFFPLIVGIILLKLKRRQATFLTILYIIILIISTTVKLAPYIMETKENIKELDVNDVSSLLFALKNENYHIKKQACEALIELRNKDSISQLILALNDKSFYTRYFAGKTLGEIGDSRAIGPLIAALNNEMEDKFQRQPEEILYIHEPPHTYVVRALIKITGQNFGDYHEKWQEWWGSNKEQF